MSDVLVVDDDEGIAGAVADILEWEGHTVRVAPHGLEGLRLLSEHLPDLIVLDVEMPELSGPDMASRLIIEDAGRELIPIVLLSGVDNLSQIAEVVGTPYSLAKPCHMDHLIDVANRALAERVAPTPAKRPPAQHDARADDAAAPHR
jgi:DNA-binding NtrC family response regulator